MDKYIPTALGDIKPKVNKLYYRGEFDESYFENCVSIVGSRRVTTYGERVLEKIVPVLVNAGLVVVSGYMYGVDKLAHKLALECGGKSVAVLGWGIDWEKKAPEKNLLYMSEYEGDQKPQLWMFPHRNRIVAGLSKVVLVVEAALGSGSLITAKYAVKYGRKLMAIPGPVTSKMSEGTNMLIKNGLAEMATGAEDILRNYKLQITNHKQIPSYNITNNNKILELLGEEAMGVDEMARKLGRRVEELGVELSMLQLKGDIVERSGKFHPNI